MRWASGILSVLMMSACASSSHVHRAPVRSIASIQAIPAKGWHRVTQHETLYSIAWAYGLDYRDLAAWNGIHKPYSVWVGRVIHLRGSNGYKPQSLSAISYTFEDPSVSYPVAAWTPPARGRLLDGFSNSNKGLNYGGKIGDPIVAAAGGKIVYCGSGLRGYGNLIIIKHSNEFLTAYAYASKVLVKEGQRVKSGQIIAEMGIAHSNKAMLHFELRQNGQPVNPLFYLSNQGYNERSRT